MEEEEPPARPEVAAGAGTDPRRSPCWPEPPALPSTQACAAGPVPTPQGKASSRCRRWALRPQPAQNSFTWGDTSAGTPFRVAGVNGLRPCAPSLARGRGQRPPCCVLAAGPHVTTFACQVACLSGAAGTRFSIR